MARRGAAPKDISELVKDPNWQDTAMDIARAGGGIAEICVAIGIPKSTLYKVRKRDPEVEEMMEYWQLLAESHFEREGRINLGNKEYSYTGFKLFMINRFRWGSEKSAMDITSGGNEIHLPIVEWVNTDAEDTDDEE